MARQLGKNLFAKIERKTWRNRTFCCDLSEDAQKAWLYMLSTPRTTKCPGLIDATLLNVMEDLGWDRHCLPASMPGHEKIMKGIERTTSALNELAETSTSDGEQRWIEWEPEGKMIFVPRAIQHNFPDNVYQVKNWLLDLHEYPDTAIKLRWIENTLRSFKRRYEASDERYKTLDSYYRSILAKQAYRAEDNETKEESEKLSNIETTPGEPGVNTYKNKNKNKRENKRDTTNSASGNQKPKVLSEHDQLGNYKPEDPPSEFTERQVQVYRLLQDTEFYVRGYGIRYAIEVIDDPVRLARDLGDADAYPAVDLGLIKRLGNWTKTNKVRSKKDIGRFLMGRFSHSQERGGSYRGNGTRNKEPQEYPYRSMDDGE